MDCQKKDKADSALPQLLQDEPETELDVEIDNNVTKEFDWDSPEILDNTTVSETTPKEATTVNNQSEKENQAL